MNKTKIEWTDYTWNPVTGCTKVSQGCKLCYAEVLTKRFGEAWGTGNFRDVKVHDDRLNEPLKAGKKLHGKKVFVCDMSDLFHEDVPFNFIGKIFRTIISCPETTFQILTKRPDRMLEFFKNDQFGFGRVITKIRYALDKNLSPVQFPLKNLWIGVSCEDQKTADERIPLLLQVPAEVHFLSCEPLIGPISICAVITSERFKHFRSFHSTFFADQIQWVICGGESGHGARPMHPDWARQLRDQCKAASVPFLFKQWGEWEPDSHVSHNGPFCLHSSKHWIINIDGRGHIYRDVFEYDPAEEKEPQLTKEDNAWWMANTGKHRSGNFLDGVQHLEFPITKI